MLYIVLIIRQLQCLLCPEANMRVLVLYKDFCVFLAHKPHKKFPQISDSKIITFYTNTTPLLADFAKKYG